MNSVLQEHLEYLSLPHRLRLFQAAVRQVVAPDSVVLDAGCGTAVLGLICLEFGASRIYAVDATLVTEVAKETFKRLGLAAQVSCIRGSTFQVSLPEPVDIVICDHVGYFGFDYGLIELLADARRRFLKPQGTLIPGRLILQTAMVESAEWHGKAGAWAAPEVPAPYHWLREHGINTKHAANLVATDLISSAADLCDLDLYADQPDYFSWSAQLIAGRDGVVHGLAGWFRSELVPNVWMTNSPLDEASIRRPQAFLPVSEPLEVTQGDAIDVTIMARPADNLIAWTLTSRATGKSQRQSTWLGDIVEQERLRNLQPTHVPTLTNAARARQIVVGYCDGQRSVADIQTVFLRDCPGLFPSEEEMRRFVTSVLAKETL